MSLLQIKTYPDSILLKKAKAVLEVTKKEKELMDNMLYTMHKCGGIGLAAPQVGVSRKLFVAEIDNKIIKLTNPSIVEAKGMDKMAEGCLSVPGIDVEVKRPAEIVVVGMDERGKVIEIKAKGIVARVIQHEMDHLNGKLIIDYAGFYKKIQIKSKLKKQL